jgi:hypothetical protein
VTAAIIGDPTRPYNGNTNATLAPANFSLSGVASGESFTVTKTSGTYDTKEVTATTVTTSLGAGDFTAGAGTLAGNYVLPTMASGPGHITAWNANGYGFYTPVGVPNSLFVQAPGLVPGGADASIWNTVKGGSGVPLKFNVYAGTTEITSTAGIIFSATQLPTCSTTAPTEEVEYVFDTSGNTSLRYDLTEHQFIQNWKTPKVNADTCFRATAKFPDGSWLSAFFKLRK